MAVPVTMEAMMDHEWRVKIIFSMIFIAFVALAAAFCVSLIERGDLPVAGGVAVSAFVTILFGVLIWDVWAK
jgi:hypothetical protein